jgi:Fe-S-cluster containining protein
MTKSLKKPMLDCTACGGACCKYFALEIDKPETPEDYDNIRWYLAHDRVNIFVEKKKWYLQVNTACRSLDQQGRCRMYEQRPQICRDYGWQETQETECHGQNPAEDHDHFFGDLEAFEKHMKAKKIKWASLAADN